MKSHGCTIIMRRKNAVGPVYNVEGGSGGGGGGGYSVITTAKIRPAD